MKIETINKFRNKDNNEPEPQPNLNQSHYSGDIPLTQFHQFSLTFICLF